MKWQYKIGIVTLLGIAGLDILFSALRGTFHLLFWIAPTATGIAGATYIFYLGRQKK